MRNFFRSPLFRCLVCLILVGCVLVNLSPIRADAFAGGAALTAVVGSAAAVAVVAGAMHALGVMPTSDTSVFEGVVNDCVDALTASGVFLNGMTSILQLSDGVVVKNHVNQGIIQAILDWLFANDVATEQPVAVPSGKWLYNSVAFPPLPSFSNFDSTPYLIIFPSGYLYAFSSEPTGYFNGSTLYWGPSAGGYYEFYDYNSNGYYLKSSQTLPSPYGGAWSSTSVIWSNFDFYNRNTGELIISASNPITESYSQIAVAAGLAAGQIGADIKTDYETWVEEGVVAVDFGIGYVDDPNTHNDDDEDGDDDTGTEIGPTVPPGELDPPSPDTQVAPSPSPSPWWKNNKWLNIGGGIVGWELGKVTRYLLDQTQTDVQTGTADPQYKPDTSLFGNGGNGNNTVVDPDPPTSDPSNPTTPSDPEISVDFPMMFDLKDFFPFCIPFDLYDFFSVLDAPPEAPQFHWELCDLSGNIYPIDVDLSTWDDLASFFRKLQLFLFITGLAAATRKYIKW